MEFLEVGGIFLSVGRTEAQVSVDCDVRVVACGGKEGRDTSGCARGVVKCELCEWEEFGPIVLLVVAVDSEVLFESLVRLLGLTISFWVITRGEMQGHSECFPSERKKWETNSEPLSEVTWVGTPCLENTCMTKSLASSGEVMVS